MQRQLSELRSMVKNRLADLKSVDRLISQPTFKEHFDKVTEDERDKIACLVMNGASRCVRDWYKEKLIGQRSLGEKTVLELRRIGQELHIEGYFNMPKAELLSEIARAHK